ncbi:DNA invertase Pin-like site-specific DNA recombinase [Ruminiclostridium sufflavum DSM 19573]|uniref:DNA invertase Pin-like site-specific DNA recombinase n=1 Tax=Ruminiclostridium sufflavum DSM 19573 TaxID=1121337 RepID=A0A318XIB7_9FIRM|nr:recombinase family protein [Ruminiclostridium sufflavum]PYG86774.1 DNA invertase Pin-like site-specific DNA recombinase [Ruminiclostridium sufflavum DSM 19573]
MERACGYIRVSTEGQVKQGYSLEEQREEIIKYCLDNGLELVKIYDDKGISGARANEDELSIDRDGLMDMLAGLKNDNIKYVVVLSTSRLWRSDMVKVLIHRELKKHDVDIRAIDRPTYTIYSNNPNDILINGMFELLDTYERLEIALKLKRGRVQKAKDGGYSGGGVPYGYVSKRGSKVMEIDDRQAEAVRRVFELRSMCPWLTLRKISDVLNMEDYKGKNGGNFNVMLVKRILDKEDFYKGVYRYSGIQAEGRHGSIL